MGGGGGEGQRYVCIIYIKKGFPDVGRLCIFLLFAFVCFLFSEGLKHQEIILSFFQVGALTDCEDIINSVNGFEFGPVLEPDEISDSRQCCFQTQRQKKLRLWKYKRSLQLRWENGKEDLSKKARMALRQLMN